MPKGIYVYVSADAFKLDRTSLNLDVLDCPNIAYLVRDWRGAPIYLSDELRKLSCGHHADGKDDIDQMIICSRQKAFVYGDWLEYKLQQLTMKRQFERAHLYGCVDCSWKDRSTSKSFL